MQAFRCNSLYRLCPVPLAIIALAALLRSGGGAAAATSPRQTKLSPGLVTSNGAPVVTYPNQAYSFAGGTFEVVPGFTNIKAFAVEEDRFLAVRRDGTVIGNGGVVMGQASNAVAVGLSAVQSAALTAGGRIIQFDDYDQPSGLTNVIAFDVFGQFADDDGDFKLAVTTDSRLVLWDSLGRFCLA